MKTQISRHSDRPDRNYSGVYQQQGRMLLDADANELMEIVKRRQAEAVTDVVDAGAPRRNGVVDVTRRPPRLSYGHVYVDGLHSRLEPGPGGSDDVYADQAQFPSPPDRPATPHLLYVDLWERPVLALEDPELIDPALNGADTCTRTMALAQLKWCAPASGSRAQPPCLDPKVNPPRGDAELAVSLRDGVGQVAGDPCDPNAIEIDPAARVGNYVFRLEVHHVEGSPADPTRVVLKWSSENASEAYPSSDLPPTFEGDQWVYEHYDSDSERHLGVHLAPGFVPLRGLLAGAIDAGAAPYLRRWDGALELVRTGTTWALGAGAIAQPGHPGAKLGAFDRGATLQARSPVGAQIGAVEVTGGKLTANLSRLQLQLSLSGHCFVAGDHWLVTVRERAAADRRARLVSSQPLGIIHHVLLLGPADGADGVQLDDAARRRLSFPSLTDLSATDVAFDSPGGALLTGAETVQDAIARLTGLNASHVAFSDPHCTSGLLKDATSVKGALEALCGLAAQHVAYTADPDAFLPDAHTVKTALDTLGKQARSGADVCASLLALFGRGVVAGLVPSVTPVPDGAGVKVSATTTAGTIVNGRGCVRDIPALTLAAVPAQAGVDRWLYVVDPPDAQPRLELRAGPPARLFTEGALDPLTLAIHDSASGPVIAASANATTANTQAWEAYAEVPRPTALPDGAVCLGKVGIFDKVAWIGPDDREQLLPTPALTAQHWRTHRQSTHEALKKAYTAGPPTLTSITFPDGNVAMADGTSIPVVVNLVGTALGANVTVSLSGIAGLPATVVIPAGQASVTFALTLPVGQAGTYTITAAIGGPTPSQVSATVSGVSLDTPQIAARLAASTTATMTVRLTAPAPKPVTVALVAQAGLSLSAASVVVPVGQQTATVNVTLASDISGPRTITLTRGPLTQQATITAAKLAAPQTFSSAPLDGYLFDKFLTVDGFLVRVNLTGVVDVAVPVTFVLDSGLTLTSAPPIAAGADHSDCWISPASHINATRTIDIRLGTQSIVSTVTIVDPKAPGEKSFDKPIQDKHFDAPGGPGLRAALPDLPDDALPEVEPGAGERGFIGPELRPDLAPPDEGDAG